MGMSAVQVIPNRRVGGMQEIAYSLHTGFESRHIDTSLIDLDGELGRRTGPKLMRVMKVWLALRRAWVTKPPDAVLAHAPNSAAFALSAAVFSRVPVRLAVVHGNRATVGPLKGLTLAIICSFGIVTDLVFVGYAVRDSFPPSWFRSRARAHVIQNGVRLPKDAGQEGADLVQALPRWGERAQVITTGRLVPGKNIAAAVRAVGQLGQSVTLVVCGDGPELRELKRLTRRLGIRAEFHGNVSRTRLSRLYQDSIAFLFPTKGEGLPLVLIEVAASGLPVIASDYPFNREVMGDAAIYCDPDDAGAWARAIESVVGDSARRELMRARGLARAEAFSVDRMVDRYVSVLASGMQ